MRNKNITVSIVVPTRNRGMELERLVKSIKKSSFNDYEVIIVNDSVENFSPKSFPFAKIINNRANKGLAFSRTKGARLSSGKYVLFIDDDNVIDIDMVKILFNSLENNQDVIAIGPVNYYLDQPNKISFLGVSISLATSKASFFKNTLDSKLIKKELLLTGNLHNCFMTRKELGDKVGWFDEKLFMSGTEFDMFMKIKKIYPKKTLATNLKAICYHDAIELSGKNISNFSKNYSSREKRLYYTQRNRGVLTGRYGGLLDKILLATIFYPFFFFIYLVPFLVEGKKGFLVQHLKGTSDGYRSLLHNGSLS
jgi:GT2 family glycosyltransferase